MMLVGRGLLVTLRSNPAVSQTFTVLSSDEDTKNMWSGDTGMSVLASECDFEVRDGGRLQAAPSRGMKLWRTAFRRQTGLSRTLA